MLNAALQIYNFLWSLEAHAEQRLAWEDAELARAARVRAEALAQAQLQAMLTANPSGQLGLSKLNDEEALRRAGLL